MAFLHASKSGYFPFCLEEATEGEYGPGTLYPFEMSLEDAMALYWKYRSLKITGSINGNVSGIFEDVTYTWIWTVTGTGSLIDNPQLKMSDLVCNNFSTRLFNLIVFRKQPLPSDPIAISNLEEIGISYRVEVAGSVKKPANQQEEIKIYPFINFTSRWESQSEVGGGVAEFFLQASDPGFESQTSISDGFQIKINGTTYKAPMYLRYDNFITSVSASGFLLIEGVDERLAE